MSKTSPIILILGAGANVGQHVARSFRAKGYRVALTSRKAKGEDTKEEIHVAGDLTDPSAVAGIFAKVKSTLGAPPSVVVYNAAAATANKPDDPLSLAVNDFTRDLQVNTVSAFVAAQQAAQGFQQLPDAESRTFIYTGNALNTTIIPPLLDLGVGKSGTAHIIQSAAAAYKANGFKFYYADERKADGSPAYTSLSGEAHGEHYLQLAERKEQGPWQQTFVRGAGYQHFPPA